MTCDPTTAESALASLTTEEWRALIYLYRFDEISQFATETDVQAVIRQFDACAEAQVRSAMASVIGALHLAAGSFAEAGHWMTVATGEAVPSTWVSARVSAIQANQMTWNGDGALAERLLDEAEPIEHPLSNLYLRMVRARIAFDRHDHQLVQQLVEGIESEESIDLLGVGGQVAATYHSSIALAEGRLADAEMTVRRALLLSRPGTRSHALLVDRLGHVMARCGRPSEVSACRRSSQAELKRWPSHALGSDRAFELVLSALGLRPNPEPRDVPDASHWPLIAGTSGRRIATLQSEAMSYLQAGDRDSACRTITELVQVLIEHTRSFETAEARAAAVRRLADLPALAIGLARLGDAGDAIRVTQTALRIIVGDQSRGAPAAQLADQLRLILDWGLTLEASVVNETELIDLDTRIRRLDPRRRLADPVPIPSTDWLEQPLIAGHVLLFEVADGRLWRIIADQGESQMVDLGPIAEVKRSISAFRLAAAALGLDHPDAEDRLLEATAALDTLLLGGCVWEPGESVALIPGRALATLPWRLLPTLRRVRLGLSIGGPPTSPQRRTRPHRVLFINGPGSGPHERSEVDAITASYPESVVVDEPLLTPGRLVEHTRAADVVHLAGHGRLVRSRFRVQRSFDEYRADQIDGDATFDRVANVVVLGSCDLTLSDLDRAGLAWLLLDYGVNHVVASTIDLDDRETKVVMPALHRLLADGVDPSTALDQLTFDDLRLQAAADSLVCICIVPTT